MMNEDLLASDYRYDEPPQPRQYGPTVRGAFIEIQPASWVQASAIIAIAPWKGEDVLSRITLSTGNVVETPYAVNHILDAILMAEQEG